MPDPTAAVHAGGSPAQPSRDWKTSQAVNPKIVERHCAGPKAMIRVLRDQNGRIGAYTVALKVLDGAIVYLDVDGNQVGRFHVFGDPQKKESSPGIIDWINISFPNAARLACPKRH